MKWNEIIATHGTLAHIPQAFALFAEKDNLDFEQSAELASAFTSSAVWDSFRSSICRHHTWRPRWRSGTETWQLVPASHPVYSIPHISPYSSFLSRIPGLARVSELVSLVTLHGADTLQGLFARSGDPWPEEMVLQLLNDISLDGIDDHLLAEWLNGFLTSLHRSNSLTDAIRRRIANLPLLPAEESRTRRQRRVSVVEWTDAMAIKQLHVRSQETENSLYLLHAALPDWSCLVTQPWLPEWCGLQLPPPLDIGHAASAVLSQSRLAGFPALAALVQAFTNGMEILGDARLAVRYLMHGRPGHANSGEKLLFVPSTEPGKEIWSRLIKQLLIHENGADSWRLLHIEWARILNDHTRRALMISSIDESGAWEELMTNPIDLTSLEFPTEMWPARDVATLLSRLYNVGESDRSGTLTLLRRLRIHTLRAEARERVSIADADGKLADLHVLDTPEFDELIPDDLRQTWNGFLSTTKIVERLQDVLASRVQDDLFQRAVADGHLYAARLDWNYVVRRCLESPKPCDWAPLIMEALSHGDQAVQGLGPRLQQSEWLPLKSGGSMAPDSVILIDGFEADLHKLLDPVNDGLAGVSALHESVSGHKGFSTLKKYLPSQEKALETLGLWLKDKPELLLGLVESSTPLELDKFLPVIETLSELPGAQLLAKLWRLDTQKQSDRWDKLLREKIWPSMFQPFPRGQEGVARLERILLALASPRSNVAFNAYLRQAVADSVIEQMLPRLSMVNQRGQWMAAGELIWPSENLDPSAQLCREQAEILDSIRGVEASQPAAELPDPNLQFPPPARGNQLESAPDFAAQATILADYLRPFRDGNVGEILPAALVAILGTDPAMLALLRELLKNSLRQNESDFLSYLLGETRTQISNGVGSQRFLIEVVHGTNTLAQTITGHHVTVGLTPEIKTFIVGDPSELWRRHFYQQQPETGCHRLRLRAIERPDELPDAVDVFATTIETILHRVHCNGVANLCPDNLRSILGEVADAGQADLRRSQLYLLDMAEARLKELAVRGSPELEQLLARFGEARHERVNAGMLSKQAPTRAGEKSALANKIVNDVRSELVGLLESDKVEGPQRSLVQAVRRKMTDFQYTLDSVTLELFQNADDAVAEWEEMKKSLHPQEREFVVHLAADQKRLDVIHWGRPINRHSFADFPHGQSRGYQQDLEKMLTLNFSDKGVGTGGHPSIVTGRFGLGFKTVFFVAERPQVISGRLAFEIRGGFYPVALPPDQAASLRQAAEAGGTPDLIPTAIRLKWSSDTPGDDHQKAFEAFKNIAPMLAVFSRRIRTLRIQTGDDAQTITNEEKDLTCSGLLKHVQVVGKSYIRFCCHLRADDRPASILLPVDANGIARLPKDLPRVWITTPTTENSEFFWALNAPFKPDAGRQRLALNNPINHEIADQIAGAWLKALVELCHETTNHWGAFAEKLGLHSDVTSQKWWTQTWDEMALGTPVLKWDRLHDGGQVLGFIAWGETTGAMTRLVQKQAVIPTKIPGTYSRLVKSDDVHFSVTGLLANQANGCFAEIADWASIQTAFPPGQTVDSQIAKFLKTAVPSQKLKKELRLLTALETELGTDREVNHLIGGRIGKLFLKCPAVFTPNTSDPTELQPILELLGKARFLAADKRYHPAGQLLCCRPFNDIIEPDEAMRAAFAPDASVLSSGYSEDCLHFFIKARGQLTASAMTLAEWVNHASPEKLPFIFDYLIKGDLDQELADELGRPWLEKQRNTSTFRRLTEDDRNELERKFARGLSLGVYITPVEYPIEPPPAEQVMQAEDAFRLVSEWWTQEHTNQTRSFEARTYPSRYPGQLHWPGEDGWDDPSHPNPRSRWLLLFIHAALVPLGFNRIGRDQSFSRFLVEKGWMDVFGRVASEPDLLFTALDNYLGSSIQNTQFHFQLRQFIAFYAVSRNLDTFLYSLTAAEFSSQPGAFSRVFDPNASQGLTGTGLEAPPLSNMLGIGCYQLLRELYRLGRISNPRGYRYAFTPIRKVRRLCMQLFGIPEGYKGAQSSSAIFSRLDELATVVGFDATFNHCFDLPFQILAEDPDLRTRVLKMQFDAEAMDSPELDAAPRIF